MKRYELGEEDFRVLHRFRSEIRRFLRFSEEAARAAGIEPQQHQLLLAVKAAPDGRVRIAEIAAALWIRHHSAVELVDRTLRQGLVRRERSERDRREVNVLLTPEGERILHELSVHHRAELQRTGPQLVAVLESIIERAPEGEPAALVAGR